MSERAKMDLLEFRYKKQLGAERKPYRLGDRFEMLPPVVAEFRNSTRKREHKKELWVVDRKEPAINAFTPSLNFKEWSERLLKGFADTPSVKTKGAPKRKNVDAKGKSVRGRPSLLWEGVSVTGILRRLGALGWTAKRANVAMKKLGVALSEKTVDTQIYFGRTAQRKGLGLKDVVLSKTTLAKLIEAAPVDAFPPRRRTRFDLKAKFVKRPLKSKKGSK